MSESGGVDDLFEDAEITPFSIAWTLFGIALIIGIIIGSVFYFRNALTYERKPWEVQSNDPVHWKDTIDSKVYLNTMFRGELTTILHEEL